MADRDLTRFLPVIVLGSLIGLIIILQIPIPDSHAEDVRDENNVVTKNVAGLLRFGSNVHSGQTILADSHDETILADSHDETILADSHDETILADSHDETILADSHDEISPTLRKILDRINDLEKNQENLQKDLRELIDKLKDET